MENNEVFAAEAEIDVLHKTTSKHGKTGRTPVTLAAAYASPTSSYYSAEEQPLLGTTGRKRSLSPGSISKQPTWTGDRDFVHLPWWHTPSIWWLLPPFALFAMAFGGTIVIKINIILSLICRNYLDDCATKNHTFHIMPVLIGSDNPQCQIPEVQALVSKFTLYGSLISGILSAITSPKLGALSDKYGRTRMICLSTLGMLINEAIFIVVATYPDTFSVNWLLLGYFFDGVGGSFIAAMAISYAYASDCTPPNRRNVVFGYYQGCLFGGIALGPFLGGSIVRATGNILSVFYFALASHFLFLLNLLLIVPESVSEERQRASREKNKSAVTGADTHLSIFSQAWDQLQPILKVSNLLAPLSILWPTGPGTKPALRRNLFFLAAVDTTTFGVAMGAMTVILIYSEFMFGWGNYETNVFMSVVNICRLVVLLVFLPLINRILRGPPSSRIQNATGCDSIDLGIIRVAILFDVIGYVGYSTVRTGSLFMASGALASLGGLASPTLQSALTKHVPPDRTGQILGAMGLLHASARVLSPVIFNLIYAETVGKFTQTVFVCLAATWGLAFVFALCIRPNVRWDKPSAEPEANGSHVAGTE